MLKEQSDWAFRCDAILCSNEVRVYLAAPGHPYKGQSHEAEQMLPEYGWTFVMEKCHYCPEHSL